MFRFFKNKNRNKDKINAHECDFKHFLGFYYKLYRTEYRDSFDHVVVYARVKCDCGNNIDREVSDEKFISSMYHCDNSEREDYIKRLEKKGILDECSFNIKTNLYSNRVI